MLLSGWGLLVADGLCGGRKVWSASAVAVGCEIGGGCFRFNYRGGVEVFDWAWFGMGDVSC